MSITMKRDVFRKSLICVVTYLLCSVSFAANSQIFSLSENNLEYDQDCQFKVMDDNSLFAGPEEATAGRLGVIRLAGDSLAQGRYRLKFKFKGISQIDQEPRSEVNSKKVVTITVNHKEETVLTQDVFVSDLLVRDEMKLASIKTDWFIFDKHSDYQCQIFWHGDVDVRFYGMTLKAVEKKSLGDLLDDAERQHVQAISDCLDCLGMSCIRLYSGVMARVNAFRHDFRDKKAHED